MNTEEILHKLRNPYGFSPAKMRQVRLAAADEIELWKDAYSNLREFAENSGLNVNTVAGVPAANEEAARAFIAHAEEIGKGRTDG